LLPSTTLLVSNPSEEVASCCHAPPEYEPRRIPAALGSEMPLPPLAADRADASVSEPSVPKLEVAVAPKRAPPAVKLPEYSLVVVEFVIVALVAVIVPKLASVEVRVSLIPVVK
jgi:hypothetical protein